MEFALRILVMVFLLITAISLFAGLFGMGRGSESSNKFMRYRVVFQGITVALLVIWLLVRNSGG